MSTARHWHRRQLLAMWIMVPVAVALLRLGLVFGTHRGSIVDGRVAGMTGFWPPAFASFMTAFGAVVGVLFLAGVTAMWVAGRKERAARHNAETQEHRKVLM